MNTLRWGILRPREARLLAYSALLLYAGCSERHEPLRGQAFLLEQARGAALGMSWTALRTGRPRAFADDRMVWEHVEPNVSNVYLFDRGREPGGSTGGVLHGIVMERTFPEQQTAEYLRDVAEVRNRWEHLAGAPVDSALARVPPTTIAPAQTRLVVRWRAAGLDLLLDFDPQPTSATGTHLRRATVRDHCASVEAAAEKCGADAGN